MTWRLLLLLAAGPQISVSPWSTSKGLSSCEARFTDPAGVAHVVRFELSATKQKKAGELVQRSRYLTVTHSAGKKNIFRAEDFVDRCEFELTLEVIEGSIRLTDLDDDGEPEVSFIYRLACRSDVSALTAKLLMYEGSTKYALRGTTRERTSETEYEGGQFTVDPSFEQAPRPFIEFARAQWKSLIVEAASPR